MTTAPTPEEVHALAARLEHCVAKWGKQNALSLEAYSAVKMMRRLQAENEAMRETLEFVERWAVHHASKPHMTAELALGSIQHHPEIRAITERYADGKRPETFDPYARIAELEARKPLPLSDEQIEKLREQTFSTNNPFCPCDSKTMRKAVRAAERAHGITGGSS